MPQPPESRIRILVTTFAKEEEASDVVRTLVREHLAACGTLLPRARSIYAWEGSIEDSEEVVVLLKTTTDCATRVADRLKALHSYEVPEVLVLDADCANAAYGQWIADFVSLDR